ncbi:BSD domain-containing protein 1-like isoform X2 [Coccinella septempunctata]|uniref:BSD domain-containing protein 1-like isoform X2 n=1 Tax=Coccinella septempunctata TaxID=41139 RepID=UPI001D07A07D|nr:BSD domain-containing protein 1-like isoform X2 [Coccinella septempunctata]
MAENNENWIGSWFTAAKEKLKNSEVLESVYKDLGEFGGAVTKGASNVLSTTGNVLEKTLSLDSPDSTANSVKRSFSTFLDQMNTVLNPSPDDSDTEAIMIVEGSETITLTKLQQIIYDLQSNEKTFTTEPEPSLSEQYKCWLQISEEQVYDEKIEKYLKRSDILQRQYEKLVPDKVDKDNFWKRYLFKKALLEDELAKQEIQEKKEFKENKIVEESVQWEKEFADGIELTEEQQIKLLEEYEKETKSKKKSPVKKKSSSNDVKTDSASSTNSPVKDNSGKDTIIDKITKVASAVSLDTASSNSSIDDDWVKISEVEK